MPGKILLATAAVLLVGAGFPASDVNLGRVAGSADAVDSHVTLEPAKSSVSVTVNNTTGESGLVFGWLGETAGANEQSSKSPSPKPSISKSPSKPPSKPPSKSPSPKPSKSQSPSPSQSSIPSRTSSPPPSGALPQTGPETSLVAVLGGGSVGFGTLMLGLAWLLRRRKLRDQLS